MRIACIRRCAVTAAESVRSRLSLTRIGLFTAKSVGQRGEAEIASWLSSGAGYLRNAWHKDSRCRV